MNDFADRPARRSAEPLILIIDDNHDLCDLYAQALRSVPMRVEVAHSEATGWTMALLTQPDLILLDVDLGHTNGLDLLERFNEHDWPGAAPKIIVFTSSENGRFRERAYELDAAGYLIKASTRIFELPAVIAATLDGGI